MNGTDEVGRTPLGGLNTDPAFTADGRYAFSLTDNKPKGRDGGVRDKDVLYVVTGSRISGPTGPSWRPRRLET